MELVIIERASINALTYMVLILMAYFGPNADLLGNIKLAIWHFKNPIDDIGTYIYNVGLLFVVDILSLVISCPLIWICCKINMLKMVRELQRDYWLLMALAESFILNEVLFGSGSRTGNPLRGCEIKTEVARGSS